MDQKVIKNILVVNVNWLGDVLMSSPIFSNLKKAFPRARIVCMAPPRVKDIISCIPYVDEVFVYDEDGVHRSILGKLKMIFQLRAYHFDQAFILHKSLTRALIVFLSGISQRIGYDTKKRGIFLTHKYSLKINDQHRLDEYQNLLKEFGIALEEKNVKLDISSEQKEVALKRLESLGVFKNDFKVLIHPAANWNLKRWPKENFTKLIERLVSELKAKVIITGSKQESELVDEILVPLIKKPIILVGQTNLPELAAMMSQVDVVVSADSGPMHLASACCSNVIVLFGPTRPEVTGPRGSARTIILQHQVGCNAKPCYHLSCPDNVCMQSITVEEVIDAVKQIRN